PTRRSDLTPRQLAAQRQRRSASQPALRRAPISGRPRPARSRAGQHRTPPPRRRADGPRRSLLWRWRRPLFVVGLLGFALVAGAFFALSRVSLPTPQPLPQTTFIYDSAGHQLTSYQVQNRVNVPYKAVPPILVHAVVSTEDRNFFTEGAINPVSIVRAFISDLRGNSLQGGSTITQQYVKQTYLNSQRTVTRKVREAAIAVKLAHTETKDQILDSYLNTIYFGRGAYGVQAASEAYFGKPVGQDGLREASLLAGLIREPVNADPAHDAALARAHQTGTLNDMVRDQQITQAQAQEVEATPFSSYVQAPAATPTTGNTATPGDSYFLDAVHQQLVATYGAAMVDTGGLRVTTTLDPNLQAAAYNAVYGTGP
ncbi:MAG: transglycosylase domain-containing protein, partial [Acidimicrobiales bacterium]